MLFTARFSLHAQAQAETKITLIAMFTCQSDYYYHTSDSYSYFLNGAQDLNLGRNNANIIAVCRCGIVASTATSSPVNDCAALKQSSNFECTNRWKNFIFKQTKDVLTHGFIYFPLSPPVPLNVVPILVIRCWALAVSGMRNTKVFKRLHRMHDDNLQ